jgi:hypothetical protein
MRHPSPRPPAYAGLASAAMSAALSILGAPRIVGVVLLVLSIGLFIVAAQWWFVDRGDRRNDQRPLESAGKAIADYEVTKRDHGDKRRQAIINQLNTPKKGELKTQVAPDLTGPERDELRRMITAGARLDRSDAGVESAWSESAATWLDEHRQERYSRRFREAEGFDQKLKELRTALTQSIPAGIALDLTPIEALDRWMEVEGIPEGERQLLRERTETYLRDEAPSRSEKQQRPDPRVAAANRAADLLMEMEDFRPKLLVAVRDAKRSGLPVLPKGLVEQILDWNRRVVTLADECLSVREATEVESIAPYARAFAPMGGKQLVSVVDNNETSLRLILRRLELRK